MTFRTNKAKRQCRMWSSFQFTRYICLRAGFFLWLSATLSHAEDFRYAQDFDLWYETTCEFNISNQKAKKGAISKQHVLSLSLVHVYTEKKNADWAEIGLNVFTRVEKPKRSEWHRTQCKLWLDIRGNIVKIEWPTELSSDSAGALMLAIDECFVGLPGYDIREKETWVSTTPADFKPYKAPELFRHLIYSWEKSEIDAVANEETAVFESWFQEVEGTQRTSEPPNIIKSHRRIHFSRDKKMILSSERRWRVQVVAPGAIHQIADALIKTRLLSERDKKVLGVGSLTSE
mgnify:FL=1